MTVSGPTLNAIGTFSFDELCTNHPPIENKRAIECVINQVAEKLKGTGILSRVYILDGRTGSGKSTLFIAELLNKFKTRILVAEPRIVLTRNNTFDIIDRNPALKLGVNIGFKNSNENLSPSNANSITFMTTQLLVNQLATYNDFFEAIQQKYIIIVDEAHLLDIQTLDLLKSIKLFLEKYGTRQNCPLFILQSATLRIKEFVQYFFPKDYKKFRSDWTSIGHVSGSSNYAVEEQFMDPDKMSKLIELEKQKKSPAEIIASYYLYHCKSIINGTERFVHLIFLPYIRGITEFGMVVENHFKSLKIPVHFIAKSEGIVEVNKWRSENPTRRVLIIPVARGYANASDVIIDGVLVPQDKHLESLLYVSTNVIETGKTIKDLTFGLDCGFDTVACFNPLMFDIDHFYWSLKQVPESKSKAIQRLGRLGRECPGTFLHFMTKSTYDKLTDYEPPETVNGYCISRQLYESSIYKLWTRFDYVAANVYIIKFTIDILISSIGDLIRAGLLTVFSEITDFGLIEYDQDYKLKYICRWLHYVKKVPLREAIFTAVMAVRGNDFYFCTDYTKREFKKIEELNESQLTGDTVLLLQKANRIYLNARSSLTEDTVKNIR